NPGRPGVDHALPEPIEVRLIKLGKIKLGFPAQGRPGAGPEERSWGKQIIGRNLGGPFRLLPGPEPKEVVIVRGEEIEICRVIESWRRVDGTVVLQVAPGV